MKVRWIGVVVCVLFFQLLCTEGVYSNSIGTNQHDSSLLAQSCDNFPIVIDPSDQQYPAIYGDIVVWQDKRNENWDIYGYNLSTEEEFSITKDPSDQQYPAIYRDIVVWADSRNGRLDIYGYDLSTKEEFRITTNPSEQSRPAISGDIVVWEDYRNGDWNIYGYNLSTEREFQVTTGESDQQYPAIYGDIVVWMDWRNGNCDVYGYNLSTEEKFSIVTDPRDQWSPAIYGDIVVWADNRNGNYDIYGHNVLTEEEFQITADPGGQQYPAIYGDIIVWADSRNGRLDIRGYNLSTEEKLSIITDPRDQWSPAIYGDIVVWADNRNGNYDIYGYNLCEPFIYNWIFEPKENGSVHVDVTITICSPRLSYWLIFPAEYPVENIEAWEVETGNPIAITPIEEEDKIRYVFEFDKEKEKGFQFIVKFDQLHRVSETDEVYYFSWEWTTDHNTLHTATVILPKRHELLDVKHLKPIKFSSDQDQISVTSEKEVSEAESFEFEIAFSRKGKELIEKAEKYFDQGRYNEARSAYLEAITFYSKSRIINDQNKDDFLANLQDCVENINNKIGEPEEPFTYDWTFEPKADFSVHVDVTITIGSPRLSYWLIFPAEYPVENIEAWEVGTGNPITITLIEEEDKIRYVFEFDKEKEKEFQFIVKFDQLHRVSETDEVYYFSWEWTTDHNTLHTATVILPKGHELLSIEYVTLQSISSDQDQISVTFEKSVLKLESFRFGVTFSKIGEGLTEEEIPREPFTYNWIFEPKVDGNVHAKVTIKLGSPCSSYSFSFPKDSLVEVTRVQDEEGNNITFDYTIDEEENKRVYKLEFDTEKEKGFTFIMEFDQLNKVEKIEEVYYFSWERTIDHDTIHTAEVILPEGHELLSVKHLDPTDIRLSEDSISVVFEEEVSESEPFKFRVTFSKKGMELTEDAETFFDQKEYDNAKSKYQDAIDFYSRYLPIGQNKSEILAKLEDRVKKIDYIQGDFTYDWIFEPKVDGNVHAEVTIKLGSPCSSYLLSFPKDPPVEVTNVQDEEGNNITFDYTINEEENKIVYRLEFDTEKKEGSLFTVIFRLKKVDKIDDGVYYFSWEWEKDHNISHTIMVIFPEKHEPLSPEPLDYENIDFIEKQIYITFEEKNVPELELFKFGVTFSDKGRTMIDDGDAQIVQAEFYIAQSRRDDAETACNKAIEFYDRAIEFYESFSTITPIKNPQKLKDEARILFDNIKQAYANFEKADQNFQKGNCREAKDSAEEAKKKFIELGDTVKESESDKIIKNAESCIRIQERNMIIVGTVVIISLFGIGISQRERIESVFYPKFEPIYPNPYVVGPPIRSEKIFFGREDVFRFIKRRFSAERRNIAIVLHGERKTGKTSILYQIENQRLGKEFVPVHIDLQAMAGVNEKEFFAKITDKITESLVKFPVIDPKSSEYSQIRRIARAYETESNPYQVFDKLLDKVSQVLKKKYLILMFDEYEILRTKIRSNELSPDLTWYVRHLIQDRERLAFIFVGSETPDIELDLMLSGATLKKISFLEKNAALDLMSKPVDDKIHYNKKAVNSLLRLTAYQPYFLQLFLQNLVDHLNEIGKNRVTEKEITYVLDDILNNLPPHLSYVWKDSKPQERIALSALSEIIKSEKQYIPVQDVMKKLQENGATLDEDTIKKTLEKLTKKEILGCKRGEAAYNFKIDFLRYWIENEYPLFRKPWRR